jgi:hypothetical protein
MTYSSDPTRWSSSHGDAPELLRDAFSAGTQEGPNNLQMRALALKLAAVGTGAALAAGAATAQASTTAAGGVVAGTGAAVAAAAKTGGALTLSKIAVSLALVGAAATGAVMLQRSPAPQPTRDASASAYHQQARLPGTQAVGVDPMSASLGAPVRAAPVLAAPAKSSPAASATLPSASPDQAVQVQPKSEPAAVEALVPAVVQPASGDSLAANPATTVKAHRAAHVGRVGSTTGPIASDSHSEAHAANEPAANQKNTSASKSISAERVVGGRQQLSEIDLLRSARSALAARPREAYRLTEEHKALYPQGVFAQERDALAVEAVQRAGDLKLARRLAEVFVASYPSSPHAHRFRETMNLP